MPTVLRPVSKVLHPANRRAIAVPAAQSVGRLRVTAGSLTLDASGGIVFTGGDTPGMDIAEGAGLTLSGRASATRRPIRTARSR